ncbi:integrase, catalytic region, zinc finger, CCHC-type containing protein [Tanacetum coccineum]
MFTDLKYVQSLEKEIDKLESDKTDFSNIYDLLLQECVSKDVMCSYLHSLSDLDAHTELQCTVRFGNDQFAPILGYGDLVQGNIMIKRVYYAEGLNHNLFLGNDLLTGNRGSDLYTLFLQDTMSPTLICFMAKASPTQAWLWHRRLSHLNFDTINLLSKKDILLKSLTGRNTFRIQDHSNEPSSSTLFPNVSPSENTNALSLQKLEFLFSPLFEEYFTAELITPTTNVNAEENNNDQAVDAQINENEFYNIFSTPVSKEAESSTRNVDNLNMHTFYQRHQSEHRWTNDHPLEQVHGNPSKLVQTRQRQLATNPEMCMFALTVSTAEPKNIKEAMDNHAWIEAMQEELRQFDRLKV